ncbi:MAG: exopolysaccharide biosynthesis protein [Chroococcidiopsidaceae cyanobacterium CP_BM_ER_R8_30]|nr:exopolysaccharide biosynthesis protein [Chroococcidiopsidaceae cyanobacterium CP_BM_ER_R8_30]
MRKTAAVIIALAIPFGNTLSAIAIVLICLGLIEKDGVVIAIQRSNCWYHSSTSMISVTSEKLVLVIAREAIRLRVLRLEARSCRLCAPRLTECMPDAHL